MAEPIKVGDLVQVVRSCCVTRVDKPTFFVGQIDGGFSSFVGWWVCTCCYSTMPNGLFASPSSGGAAQPMSWLKKIEPLSELEGEKRDERITA